ncbi:hypothetical protein [Brevibacillus laterosporus]|uniref:Glycosyl hydrolase n=1 Tax=Brevibacillus laterosporus TaxID=1465 RepID=A0AAP3G9B8_BRELA|nr:hypothetical protein [Brevibacillus laterosporus]MCR8978616.1 hypothetical protein [Brevibacillus laterosporus]MCZ0805772.1 hypothetical protein [Brevibacillus laterosporus]MCZ0824462.1 hypothetical protein [Brevibacillus laterosporus]MCZ0848366.1 hypothetical protein [Brevibacillus laterosporus]
MGIKMFSRGRVAIVILSVLILIIAFLVWRIIQQDERNTPITLAEPPIFESKAEQKLFYFTRKHMASPEGGIHTNYLANADKTKGHAVISESVGLLLKYAVASHNKALFDQQVTLLKHRFVEGDFIAWIYPRTSHNTVNSSVDDLRIIEALIDGAQIFNNEQANDLGLRLARGLLATNSDGKWLYDYADKKKQQVAPTVQIRYANLSALEKLADRIPEYVPIYEQMKKLLEQAEQTNGLYALAYLPKERIYVQDPALQAIAVSTNMSEQIITALYAEKAGISTIHIRKRLADSLQQTGKLFATVDKQSGNMKSDIESPAVYALAAMLFTESDQRSLAVQCLTRLAELQVSSQSYDDAPTDIRKQAVQFEGGYLDVYTLQAFSFDQLESLLAMRIGGGNSE